MTTLDQEVHQEIKRKDPYFYGSARWWAWYRVKAYLTWDDVPKSGDSPGKVHHWRWAKKEYVWYGECGGLDDIAYVYWLED